MRRLTLEEEDLIIETILANPKRVIVLPDEFYTKNDRVEMRLAGRRGAKIDFRRYLYIVMCGDVPSDKRVEQPPGIPKRNINPFLCSVDGRYAYRPTGVGKKAVEVARERAERRKIIREWDWQ